MCFTDSVGFDHEFPLRVCAKLSGRDDKLSNDERVADDHDDEGNEADDTEVNPRPYLLHKERDLETRILFVSTLDEL